MILSVYIAGNDYESSLNSVGFDGPTPPSDRAADLRELLTNAGININDASNGIWLPRNEEIANPNSFTPHNQTMRQSYFDYLEREFQNV